MLAFWKLMVGNTEVSSFPWKDIENDSFWLVLTNKPFSVLIQRQLLLEALSKISISFAEVTLKIKYWELCYVCLIKTQVFGEGSYFFLFFYLVPYKNSRAINRIILSVQIMWWSFIVLLMHISFAGVKFTPPSRHLYTALFITTAVIFLLSGMMITMNQLSLEDCLLLPKAKIAHSPHAIALQGSQKVWWACPLGLMNTSTSCSLVHL